MRSITSGSRIGAWFEQIVAFWTTKDSTIELKRYGPDLDTTQVAVMLKGGKHKAKAKTPAQF